jgi:hypothetical protein
MGVEADILRSEVEFYAPGFPSLGPAFGGVSQTQEALPDKTREVVQPNG